MTAVRQDNLASVLNLLIPGAGLVLRSNPWGGLVIGLLFVACANFTLWALLLVPDEFPPWQHGLGIGLTGGVYLGAQIRLAQTVRGRRRSEQTTLRRAALHAARQLIEAGRYPQAQLVLAPVRRFAETDLLVAYRMAQVYTGLRDVDAALAAWQTVRRLDRHHLYSDQLRSGLASLGRTADDRNKSTDVAPSRP
ncbi:MAG: hypothetical protein PVJ57_17870 [Phycisphaerae bacterium]|jgi:hypothetical protein